MKAAAVELHKRDETSIDNKRAQTLSLFDLGPFVLLLLSSIMIKKLMDSVTGRQKQAPLLELCGCVAHFKKVPFSSPPSSPPNWHCLTYCW
jgi:hypothetical protein